MTAAILDGRMTGQKIKNDIRHAVEARQKLGLSIPGLAVILVGEDPASASYVAHKQKACEEVGILSTVHRLSKETSQSTLEALIDQCNRDPHIHGILLQLPLPSAIKSDELLERIDPKKDVDGFHPYNLGRLAQGKPILRPCTPKGVMTLLESTGVLLSGKNAVIVGASNIVGRPMALELLLAKCTITVCHRATRELQHHISGADIIIAATGNHGIIQSDWIKPGAMVVDVGFSRLANGKIVGDIDYDTAKFIAGWITPVPGGVGPMTVATLLENTLQCANLQN